MSDSRPSLIRHWLLVAFLATIAAAHTQVTLRHGGLRIAGVHEGIYNETSFRASETASQTILTDPFAVYTVGELKGHSLQIHDTSYPVVDNTETELVLAVATEEFPIPEKKGRYVIAKNPNSVLVKLALKVPRINFTVADLLLGLCFALLLIDAFLRRDTSILRPPPAAVLVFLGICLLSLCDPVRGLLFDQSESSANGKAGIKEFIQYVEIWVVGWLVARTCLRDKRTRRFAAAVLVGVGALVVVCALGEYYATISGHTARGLLDVGEIDSLFGFRFNPGRSGGAGSESSKNVLATYLMIMVPMLLALSAAPFKQKWPRYALLFLCALGLCAILSLAHLVVCILACMLVAGLCPKRIALPITLAGIALTLVLVCTLSSHHGKILMDSAAVHRYTDTYGLLPMPIKGKGHRDGAAWQGWQQKYVERQAAINAVSLSPLLGYGLGNYQLKINSYYTDSALVGVWVPKPAINYMEPDSHGLFFVLAVETGVLGLLALVWVLAASLQTALRRKAECADSFDRVLLAGAAGAIAALLLGGFFCSFMVRGIHIIAVVLIALPWAIGERATANEHE